MDASRLSPYIAQALELLLILSALLSALTGAISSARLPEVRSHHSVAAARAAAIPVAVTVAQARRPQVALPVLARVSAAGIEPALTLALRTPLFAERRRE